MTRRKKTTEEKKMSEMEIIRTSSHRRSATSIDRTYHDQLPLSPLPALLRIRRGSRRVLICSGGRTRLKFPAPPMALGGSRSSFGFIMDISRCFFIEFGLRPFVYWSYRGRDSVLLLVNSRKRRGWGERSRWYWTCPPKILDHFLLEFFAEMHDVFEAVAP